MKAPDPFILEYIAEHGPASPTDLIREDGGALPFSRGYINTRCQDLENKEFLINIGNGMYQLKERGQDWLSGDFDARTLDEGNKSKAVA